MLATAFLLGSPLPAAPAGEAGGATEAPKIPALAPSDTALPIDLDATFSEFDRRNNRLVFRQLRVTQGTLAISADEATADPADFENSVWVFTGNVVINNADTRTTCDRAELSFRDNQLRKAELTGKPARFVQDHPGGGTPTEGRGETLDYDLEAGTIRMTTDAFLSDGSNEISGTRIAYDLRREVVTAGEGDSGKVRMKITPRPKSTGAAKAPTPSPAPAPEAGPP